MSANRSVRVVIADDHALVRDGVRERLDQEEDITVVGDASRGEDALRLVLALEPDVLLLDMEMPGLSGPEVARKLKLENSTVRILALSAYDDADYVEELLNSGAAGYLTKDENLATVVEAVRGVARGDEGWLSRSVAARVMHLQRGESAPREEPHPLSDREVQVLSTIARGLTNAQAAAHLFISENTVRNHLANIYSKLELHNRAEAVGWAWKNGIAEER